MAAPPSPGETAFRPHFVEVPYFMLPGSDLEGEAAGEIAGIGV